MEEVKVVKDQVPENWDGKIMLVGEAPGAEEEVAGRPFVGAAGRQLDRMLQIAKIEREGVYITNVIQTRPPHNDFSIYYTDAKRRQPTEYLVQAWDELKAKIIRVRPRIVVALGGEAFRSLTGYVGIENRRGCIYQIDGIKVVGTFHPAAVVRGGGRSHWYGTAAVMDLIAAREAAETWEMPQVPKVRLLESVIAVERWADGIAPGSIVAFDIETTMKGGEAVRSLGFSGGDGEAVVVPLEQFDTTEQWETMRMLNRLFASPDVYWVAQNGQFDISYLARTWDTRVENYYWDTMTAHHVLAAEMPHDLASLNSFYTRFPHYKSKLDYDTDIYKVNGWDAVVTKEVFLRQQQQLRQRGLWEYYMDYIHPTLLCLHSLSEGGLRIDLEYQKELKHEIKKEFKEIQARLDTTYRQYYGKGNLELRLQRVQSLVAGGRKTVRLTNPKNGKRVRKRLSSLLDNLRKQLEKRSSLNVRSPKQLATFLYGVLKLPPYRGQKTTDETAINRLYIKTGHEFLKEIIRLRKLKKAYSDWAMLKTDGEAKVKTTYKFVKTGRLSSGRFAAK